LIVFARNNSYANRNVALCFFWYFLSVLLSTVFECSVHLPMYIIINIYSHTDMHFAIYSGKLCCITTRCAVKPLWETWPLHKHKQIDIIANATYHHPATCGSLARARVTVSVRTCPYFPNYTIL